MALLGFFSLSQIGGAVNSLAPHAIEDGYIGEIKLALNAFDKEVERYATIGGDENKEHLLSDLEKVKKITETFISFRDKKVENELILARAKLEELTSQINDLIALEEGYKVVGVNEKIVQIYVTLGSLNTYYDRIEEMLTMHFDETLEDQRQSVILASRQFAAIVVGIILLGILISLVLSRTITKPIFKLRDAANTLAAGDYKVRTDAISKDEVGQLGAAFNRMGENLMNYTTKLESEVALRTDELHKKVDELDKSWRLLSKREEELTLVNERLRELDKVKSEFISVAAHQLRTPLSAIKWTLSLLIDEDSQNLTSEQRSLLMKGYESNERIINLINDMLVVTRIEAGKIQYNFSLIHMEDLIDSVLLDFSGQAYVRKVKLAFERPASQLPYVNADPEKIRNVIQNLVENAMYYTKDGGEIIISTNTDESGFIKVMIKDNGIGIPARQQTSIFNKFFRADNAVKFKTDGSGLGLFVVKSTIEKHGGRVGFESVEGKGTTFYFSLPVADSKNEAALPMG
jgi:signal transduction histidine kinase